MTGSETTENFIRNMNALLKGLNLSIPVKEFYKRSASYYTLLKFIEIINIGKKHFHIFRINQREL